MDKQLLVLVSGCVVFTASCVADAQENLHLQAFGARIYDSNLFRDQEQDAVSDTATQYGLDGSLKIPVSQQGIFLKGMLYKASYDKSSNLDYIGGDAMAEWQWRAGRLWDGELAYMYQRALSNFRDQRLNERDIRVIKGSSANINYRFHPNWKWVIGAWGKQHNYMLDQQAILDKDIKSAYLELRFFNKARSYAGVQAHFTDTVFPNRDEARLAGLDNEYRDVRYGVKLKVEPRKSTILEANAELLRRKHEHLKEQDVSLLTARMQYTWKFTEKMRINISAWRDLDPLEDVQVDYILRRGIKLGSTFMLTSKVSLLGEGIYETRSFEGEAGTGVAPRYDRVGTVHGSLGYRVSDHLDVNLSAEYEKRGSNRAFAAYSYQQIAARLIYAF